MQINPTNAMTRRTKMDEVLRRMNKEFGHDALRFGSLTAPIGFMSSGSISLDRALRVGGFPRGRMIEVFGPEASGKTTIALHLIARVQQAGGTAAFIDAEYKLDTTYARRIGVRVDDLLVSRPPCGETALDMTERLITSGLIDVVVVDSVSALVPRSEVAGSMSGSGVSLQAVLMALAMRKLTFAVGKANAILMFTNQIREKVGVMFGNPETTTGGRALRAYSSVRLEVRRIGTVKSGDVIIGDRTRIRVAKSVVAAPFGEAEVDLIHGKGISREAELLDLGVSARIVQKLGSGYSYHEKMIGQCRDSALAHLELHPDLFSVIEADLGQEPFMPTTGVSRDHDGRRIGPQPKVVSNLSAA